MILLLVLQISREEFYQFREEVRTSLAEIKAQMQAQYQALNAETKAQMQALNQRMDALEKRIDDLRSESNTKINIIITIFTAMFAAVIGFLATFLYSWISFIREHREKKADKEEVNELKSRIKELETQNLMLFEVLLDIAKNYGNEEIIRKVEALKKV